MPSPYNTVIIVRATPLPGTRALIRQVVEQAEGPCLVFFHGPAVALVAERGEDGGAPGESSAGFFRERAGLTLRVCSAAWQRRGGGQLPLGFETFSLAGFWHAASQARQLTSIGHVQDD